MKPLGRKCNITLEHSFFSSYTRHYTSVPCNIGLIIGCVHTKALKSILILTPFMEINFEPDNRLFANESF